MPTISNRLSPASLDSLPAGRHADGDGLWLYKRDSGSAKWVLRVFVYGSRKEMGLGAYKPKGRGVSLSAARKEAAKWRAVTASGLNPITERDRLRREAERNLHSLKDVTADAFESRKAELKGDGKAGRWLSPLEQHILPKLGRVPVSEITQVEIRNALAPIWHTKADTARKAMNRIGLVLKHAAALGLDVDLQATDKARALLGKSRHRPSSIPSMPWQEVPTFYATLDDGGATHLALRLLILTGLRSAPVRFAHVDQFDDDLWTVPGEIMKGRRDQTPDFRVPLSTDAIETIESARLIARDGYLFPSIRKGVISDATMSAYMKRKKLDTRPHGFRSSFRNWAEEVAGATELVAETSLAHVVGGAVQRAYRTTDVLEKRRALMQRWADHVAGRSGKVLDMVAT
ncbi:site-specific integrase [Sulfitobacter sp. 20_GPM-1509m]|uniref:tyrosine-type recombinase/integrase n=1 Tax=Sulfitobacter sp. 20_GPM-1509m TaxID=1380367 RepID=UPI00048AAD08|nr:site-specific integrase [Sulfitobacter sp. 20_GPM-1509m]